VNVPARLRHAIQPSGVRRRASWCAAALVVAGLAQTAAAQPAPAGTPAATPQSTPEAPPEAPPNPASEPAKPVIKVDDDGKRTTATGAVILEGEDKTGTEIGLLPLIGGDTDNGFGVGAIGSIASFDKGYSPYKWQVQFATFIAARDSITSPSYEDAFVNIIVPQLMDGRLRVELRPSFTRETALHFYGYGNQINIPTTIDRTRDTYTRLHPQLAGLTRWRLHRDSAWSALLGGQYLYNQISYAASSTIGQEAPMINPVGERAHSVLRLETGIVYDTRDNEIAPHRGMYHTLEFRVSPHLGDAFPYHYEQLDLQFRFYRTVSPRNVLAFRAVGDVLLGYVPFYELSRYEDTSALGGSLAIRGVPGYAFYGKVKLFGNIELRTHVTNFKLLDRRFKFGVASFIDGGRLWSDLRFSHPELDGHGLGLHYGIGGGIRLQQGRAFLVRADIAWSPDASPIAGYVLADHIF
jgi:hypothetical protein